MPPQVNITVTKVQAASSGEAYDGPPGPGAELWPAGAAAPTRPNAYLRERRDRRQVAAGGDVIADRVIIADIGAPPIDWLVGQFVTFTRTGSLVGETGKVKLVERPTIDDPDIPADLKTVRLTMEST